MTKKTAATRLGALLALGSLLACDAPAKDGAPGEAPLGAPSGGDDDGDGDDESDESDGDSDGGGPEDDPGEASGESGEPDADADADELPPRAPPPILDGECEAHGEPSECTELGIAGVQYCHPDAGGWGPCVFEPECVPGDIVTTECALGDVELACVLLSGVPEWEDCGFTPLVLSFDGSEPEFDVGPTAFELSDGSGACLARAWPGPQTPWLAIDLDQSGAIENGRELFGSASPTRDGRRPVDGFDALRELDDDGDGRITPADTAWRSLLLWSDEDRDRMSSPMELTPAWSSGLTEIVLEHRVDRRCDRDGNCGIERSAFGYTRGSASAIGTVIDVHIPCD